MQTTSVPSPEKYSALWLRSHILDHLMDRRAETPEEMKRQERLVWNKFIKSISGDFEYSSVLDEYGNLTRHQMKKIESFIESHPYEPRAIWTIARIACLTSTDGDHYLDNTIFLYSSLAKRDGLKNNTYVNNADWNAYGIILGFQNSLESLPEERQAGYRAVTEFIMDRCTAINHRFLHHEARAEMILLKDTALKDFLMKNPSSLDDMIALVNDQPELGSNGVLAVLTGEAPKPLVTGVL